MVVMSAEMVTLLFLASATWKSLRASGLGWLLARTPYVNCDLDDMVDGGVSGVREGGRRLLRKGLGCKE